MAKQYGIFLDVDVEPPCVKACPKDAIKKREDGIVLIDKAEIIYGFKKQR